MTPLVHSAPLPEVLATLRKARVLLTPPEAWCQGQAAVTETGESTEPKAPNACRRCWWGALDASTDDFRVLSAARDACEDTIEDFMAEWNDAPGRKHAEVLAATDRTIARLEGSTS